jgi:type IV secretion system protein VirB4
MLKTRGAAMRRELTAAEHIPYCAHVAPTVVKTRYGDYLQVFRLGGASFECGDDVQLNAWHERLNVLWRNIASPHVAVWTQTIRRRYRLGASRVRADSAGIEPPAFAGALDAKYRARLGGERLMLNELYLSVLYRPGTGLAASLISRCLSRTDRNGSRFELADALDACDKLAQTLRASLARYEPQILGIYRSGSAWCSSLLEYLGLLINGEWQRIPLPRGPLNNALASTRLFFGNEAIEYRMPTETRVGALLGIAQVSSTYGAGDGQTIVENCANTLILRCSGSENGGTSHFASKLIGEREVVRRQVARGRDREGLFAGRESRRSTNISEQRITELAVLPSELERLPDLCGYFKRASSPAWFKVSLSDRGSGARR